jgi:ABC-type dipeptide/oligopeptide/nickel transport system permease subunit
VFPGLAVFATVVTFNLLGDAVAAILNPRHGPV